jgi:hypothetical protein
MHNLAMARKLDKGEALDVEKHLAPPDPADVGPAFVGVYRLERFVDDVDYCVGSTERWIWSIGKRLTDGAIFAAVDGRFYQNPAFECLFLR